MCVMLITLMFHRQNQFISFHKDMTMFPIIKIHPTKSPILVVGIFFNTCAVGAP